VYRSRYWHFRVPEGFWFDLESWQLKQQNHTSITRAFRNWRVIPERKKSVQNSWQ
jgi:hypothetical protein